MGHLTSPLTVIERVVFRDVNKLDKSPVVRGFYQDGISMFVLNSRGTVYTNDQVGSSGTWRRDVGVRALYALGIITMAQRDAHFAWDNADEMVRGFEHRVDMINEALTALGLPSQVSKAEREVTRRAHQAALAKALDACQACDVPRGRK